jgi:hypothetical protein
MHPAAPLISIILYLYLSTPVCSWIQKTFKVTSKGNVMQFLTISHSLTLAIYSIWTFYHSIIIFTSFSLKHGGLYSSFCDIHGDLWNEYNFGYWITHFYISKYYEFIDTWIVLLKGRQPILLQTYHHAGIVVIAWSLVVTQNSAGGSILILFNSFIHSFMYTYYALAALGITSPFKKYLTMAQIIQFILGIIITMPAFGCINEAQVFTLAGILLYTIILLCLFYNFFKSSYKTSKKLEEIKKQ